ncbi:MAG: VCBS repeat-containing protein [Acidobacteria bacterium]|nr:VCBS repeat-containing protein [Acidobacteriota bacterium]
MRFFVVFLSISLWAQMDVHVVDSFNANRVYHNDGTGTLIDSGQMLGNDPTLSAAYGDLDGDLDIDLINGADPGCRIYLNDGNGGFPTVPNSIFEQDLAKVQSVAVADVDLDGDLDAILGVATSQFTSQCQIFLNDGNANFSFHFQFGNNDTRAISVARINNDAYPDIFEANRLSNDRVWFNNGDGTFSDSGQDLDTFSSMSVALGDLNGDTFLDAFVALDGAPNKIWLNDGLGVFSASPQIFPTQNSLAVSLGDMNGDGSLDIVVGQDGAVNGDELEVWLNDGSGNFTLVNQNLPSDQTLGIALGDIDADGVLDVLATNFGPDALYRNDGTGHLTRVQDLWPGMSWSGVMAYLSDSYPQAIANWSQPYTIISLLQFKPQLKAETDHQRGR